MQLIESTLSLLVLISLSVFLSITSDAKIDDSLYIQELQGDMKNVVNLRGGFENLSAGNDAAMEILEKTGMCIEMGQTELTSRRVAGGAPSSPIQIPILKRALIYSNGTAPAIEISNLTGFMTDSIYFGPCTE